MNDLVFYTPETMGKLWSWIGSLLSYTSPGVLIVFAIGAIGMLIWLIFYAIGAAFKKDDDPDDFDIRHY